MRRLLCWLCLLGLGGGGCLAGSREGVRAASRYLQAHQHRIVRELVDLVSLPNLASDLPAIVRNARQLQQMLEQRGARVRILERETAPLVFGELDVPGATRTLMFYCHYDGQPVDPSRWVGGKPYQPRLRSGPLEAGGRIIPFPAPGTPYQPQWRLYGRSVSDDKSPIVAILSALDALREARVPLGSNLKFLFEGEEEAGSPHLAGFLKKYRDLLSADALIVADGPLFATGDPTLYFGVRGIVTLEITVYGPLRPVHSGHYGNWVPNPALGLARLLASMKDGKGRVRVEGFYDDVTPLAPAERQAIREVPPVEEVLRRRLGLGSTEGGRSLLEALNLPSLNIRGLKSAWVGGQARTIIPDRAIAALDLRLVKDIQPGDQVARLIRHIRRQGYYVVREVPDLETRLAHPRIARLVAGKGYPALRTPMDLPVCRHLVEALTTGLGRRPVRLPTLGGSVPLYTFWDSLKIPVIGVPTVNPDNNQHSPNENLRLGTFFAALQTFAALLSSPPPTP